MKKIAKIKKDDISEKLLDIKKDSETQENSPNPHIEDSQNEESKIKAEEQVPDLDDFKTLLDTILSEKDISKLRKVLSEHLLRIMDRHQISKSYEVLFLYDNQKSITEDTADIIYEAIPQQNKKPILLILQSKGGQIEPAYLISKTCKERAARFIVAIPRKAKSAATLISQIGRAHV